MSAHVQLDSPGLVVNKVSIVSLLPIIQLHDNEEYFLGTLKGIPNLTKLSLPTHIPTFLKTHPFLALWPIRQHESFSNAPCNSVFGYYWLGFSPGFPSECTSLFPPLALPLFASILFLDALPSLPLPLPTVAVVIFPVHVSNPFPTFFLSLHCLWLSFLF